MLAPACLTRSLLPSFDLPVFLACVLFPPNVASPLSFPIKTRQTGHDAGISDLWPARSPALAIISHHSIIHHPATCCNLVSTTSPTSLAASIAQLCTFFPSDPIVVNILAAWTSIFHPAHSRSLDRPSLPPQVSSLSRRYPISVDISLHHYQPSARSRQSLYDAASSRTTN